MNQFDFNKVTDRHNTNSIKTDLAVPRGKPEDVLHFGLPTWIFRLRHAFWKHSTKKLTTEFSATRAQTRIILMPSKTGCT